MDLGHWHVRRGDEEFGRRAVSGPALAMANRPGLLKAAASLNASGRTVVSDLPQFFRCPLGSTRNPVWRLHAVIRCAVIEPGVDLVDDPLHGCRRDVVEQLKCHRPGKRLAAGRGARHVHQHGIAGKDRRPRRWDRCSWPNKKSFGPCRCRSPGRRDPCRRHIVSRVGVRPRDGVHGHAQNTGCSRASRNRRCPRTGGDFRSERPFPFSSLLVSASTPIK